MSTVLDYQDFQNYVPLSSVEIPESRDNVSLKLFVMKQRAGSFSKTWAVLDF